MMQIPNGAWSNFLILGLKFTPWMLGIMFIIATVFSWLGKVGGRGRKERGRGRGELCRRPTKIASLFSDASFFHFYIFYKSWAYGCTFFSMLPPSLRPSVLPSIPPRYHFLPCLPHALFLALGLHHIHLPHRVLLRPSALSHLSHKCQMGNPGLGVRLGR